MWLRRVCTRRVVCGVWHRAFMFDDEVDVAGKGKKKPCQVGPSPASPPLPSPRERTPRPRSPVQPLYLTAAPLRVLFDTLRLPPWLAPSPAASPELPMLTPAAVTLAGVAPSCSSRSLGLLAGPPRQMLGPIKQAKYPVAAVVSSVAAVGPHGVRSQV